MRASMGSRCAGSTSTRAVGTISLERREDGALALRLGFRQIDGFREEWADALVAARGAGFTHVEQLAQRAGLPSRALRLLADADACGSIGLGRREALWEARRTPQGVLPLFAAADAAELGEEPDAELPAMPLSGTGGDRLPDDAPVAERPSDAVPALARSSAKGC